MTGRRKSLYLRHLISAWLDDGRSAVVRPGTRKCVRSCLNPPDESVLCLMVAVTTVTRGSHELDRKSKSLIIEHKSSNNTVN
jgi:hypothetical protein